MTDAIYCQAGIPSHSCFNSAIVSNPNESAGVAGVTVVLTVSPPGLFTSTVVVFALVPCPYVKTHHASTPHNTPT